MAAETYEKQIERLEQLVEDLDGTDLSLEQRLKKFEEGTKLARQLNKKLQQAKKKVEVLIEDQDEVFTPFETIDGEEQ